MGLSFLGASSNVVEGLINMGILAQEVIYRWLWLITKNAVEYNGTIPEKFNLETSSFLLNMVMLGLNSIIFQRRFWLGKCIIPIRFANFE
jgi:hypothetical protein